MRRSGAFLISLLCLIVLVSVASADSSLEEYYADAVDFFADSTSTLADILAFEPDPEDVPVIFMLSQITGVSPVKMAELRDRGDGWQALMSVRGAKPQDLYFMISADFESKVFSPVFEKFSSTPESDWGKIELTDQDIVNLVNLRFVYRNHGYSAFEVMAMRDRGESFPAINQKIAALKQKLMEEAAKNKVEKAREEVAGE